MIYSADFETTTELEDCRVWAWGLTDVETQTNFEWGKDIDGFMRHTAGKENNVYYFHNLRFDGDFILNWLFRNGYEHVTDKRETRDKTFTTLISDMGQFYTIKVYHKKGKKSNTATFYDSMKLYNMSVGAIAKGFKMEMQKLEIDYKTHRPVGYTPSELEIEYVRCDVTIVAVALNFMLSQGFDKMTIGANAMWHYKAIVGQKTFDRRFPMPDYDGDIRKCYKGGFTYLNPKFAGVTVGHGFVFDVNSLYPWAMRAEENRYPMGEPIRFDGKYVDDNLYDVYIQQISCNFKIKKNHIPCIQIKHNRAFVDTEYLESSNGEDVVLTLTNVDLKLMFEQYDVTNVEWLGGYKFKSASNMFSAYIDFWTERKIQAGKDENFAMYITAKLFLNNLYGKFSTNPECCSKIPYFDDDRVKYRNGEKETRKPVYLPVGAFVTAYARYKTITSAQRIQDDYYAGRSKNQFVYADTDSLHIISPDNEIPTLDIDPFQLGAWKHETTFEQAKFLRAKTYMEYGKDPNKDEALEWKITVAGMPKSCYEHVTIDNFDYGEKYEGKLTPKHVAGGIVLVDTMFTIKRQIVQK